MSHRPLGTCPVRYKHERIQYNLNKSKSVTFDDLAFSCLCLLATIVLIVLQVFNLSDFDFAIFTISVKTSPDSGLSSFFLSSSNNSFVKAELATREFMHAMQKQEFPKFSIR